MTAKRNSETPGRLSSMTAAISGALVVALLGYLLVHAIRAGDPPAIVTEAVPEASWTRAGVTYLAIDVRNEGDESARDVQIEVEPEGEGGEVRRTMIDFLAGGETSRIYVAVPGPVWDSPPGDGGGRELRVLVVGFKES
jgi:uncharacterized protein (TIGR02588 family)